MTLAAVGRSERPLPLSERGPQGVPPSGTIAAIVPRTGVYTLEARGLRGETAYPAATGYSATIEAQAYRTALAGSRMVTG